MKVAPFPGGYGPCRRGSLPSLPITLGGAGGFSIDDAIEKSWSPVILAIASESIAAALREKVLKEKTVEMPTEENGGIWIRSPNPNVNQLYDLKGNILFPRADGAFLVEPKHAQMLRRSGFQILD